MPFLNDPYGVLAGAVDVVCEKCGHELEWVWGLDMRNLNKFCCRRCLPVVRVSSTHCEECGCDLVWGEELYCPQCGVIREGPFPSTERCVGKPRTTYQHDPIKYFRFWLTHILGWEPASELGDAAVLLERLEGLMKRDKISSPSVDDCRRWLKELGRSKLYKNTTQILKWLTNADHPPIDEWAIEEAKVRFCNMLRLREKLNLGGNRCYYPFYIYKIFDEILEGEQRWVLSYIHMQSEKTREKCDKEWKKIEEELEKEISDGYYSDEAVGMPSPQLPPVLNNQLDKCVP